MGGKPALVEVFTQSLEQKLKHSSKMTEEDEQEEKKKKKKSKERERFGGWCSVRPGLNFSDDKNDKTDDAATIVNNHKHS